MNINDETPVTVTVKEKAEVLNNRGVAEYKLSVASPWFQSQYPQVIYVPKGIAEHWAVGGQYTLVLRASAKVGPQYDGSLAWHYRWRFVRVASDQQQTAAVAPAAKQELPPYDDPRGRSIERQMLFKEARTATEYLLAQRGSTVEPEHYMQMLEAVFGAMIQIWDRRESLGIGLNEVMAPAVAPSHTEPAPAPTPEAAATTTNEHQQANLPTQAVLLGADPFITAAQRQALFSALDKHGIPREALAAEMERAFGVRLTSKLRASQLQELYSWMDQEVRQRVDT